MNVLGEGSLVEAPQRKRLQEHLKDLYEENKTLMKLIADKDKRVALYMIDFEELNSLKITVNKLEKQNSKLTQANNRMLQELRSLNKKVQQPNPRPIQEMFPVEVQQSNLQPAQEMFQVYETNQSDLRPSQVGTQLQDFEPQNMQTDQSIIQMQEEEPLLENSQILLEFRSNADTLSSTDAIVRECVDMIEQLQASGPPTDEAIKQVEEKLQALGPLTFDAVRLIRTGFRKLQKLQCPRCESNNTKFSVLKAKWISAPRYHCENCKMEWTFGGEIRKTIALGGVNRTDRLQHVQRRRMTS